MRRGTKIGWLLVAVSIVLSVWVIAGQSAHADTTTDDGFIISDDGTQLKGYVGDGGDITIPDVTSIDAGAFANNQSITNVTMPDTVTTIGTGVFQGCDQMQGISLSNNLTSIPADTFAKCGALLDINIPSSVTSIGSNAFGSCESLETVTIPAATSSIADGAFKDASNLASISVASGNSYFTSVDGCLYNATTTRLKLVPEGKESVTFASTTTEIGSEAFSRCSYIDSLTIPSGVKTIEANAFTKSVIDTITIPASVTSIGTQSGWSPRMIYGYSGSTAETYAKNNSIAFVVVGNSGTTGDDNHGGTDDNGGTTTDSDGNTVDGDGNIIDSNGNVIGHTSTDVTGSTNGVSAATTGHQKDETPTTADGIDSRYFLCLAIFLGGVGVIISSRKNKMVILQEKRK